MDRGRKLPHDISSAGFQPVALKITKCDSIPVVGFIFVTIKIFVGKEESAGYQQSIFSFFPSMF